MTDATYLNTFQISIYGNGRTTPKVTVRADTHSNALAQFSPDVVWTWHHNVASGGSPVYTAPNGDRALVFCGSYRTY